MTDSAQLCESCRLSEARDPSERRLAEWARIEITDQHFPAAAPQQGLVPIAHPPVTGALTGRIELVLDGTTVGTVTLTCCPACRTAALAYIHVAAEHRRLGYGRTLVAAAHPRAPGYRWTVPLPAGGAGQASRARIPYPPAAPPCSRLWEQLTEHLERSLAGPGPAHEC